MSDPAADAQTALAVLCAEDAYSLAGATILQPAIDARLTAAWAVHGVLVGTDSLWRKGAKMALADRTVFYGWLLASRGDPTSYLCVIRGTATPEEWWEDAEAEPISRPGLPGKVERGFRELYESLVLRRPGSLTDMPLVTALCNLVGSGRVLVAGHSLGAALASFVALDLADPSRLGKRVSARLIASPRPGDGLFAQYAGNRITDCVGYRSPRDLVCDVPFGFGYCALPATIELPADPPGYVISDDPAAQHHVLSYMTRLTGSLDPSWTLPCDEPYLACIRRSPSIPSPAHDGRV